METFVPILAIYTKYFTDPDLVGVEIINLAEKIGPKDLRLENFEGLVDGIKWKVSYESEYDAAYIGFQKENVTSSKTREGFYSYRFSGKSYRT